jgi:PTS system ascorbate-specific IIA component
MLLITHGQVGRALVDTAASTLGFCPLDTAVLSIAPDSDPDLLDEKARYLAKQLDDGDGVLVLTDIYGSTPANIACRLLQAHRVGVVTGVNLPMMIRLFNYPGLSLDELALKAVSGGQDGIRHCVLNGAQQAVGRA